MNILAFDTATENCSVALMVGSEIVQTCENAPQQHAKLLLPMIDQLLATTQTSRQQLDGVVFGRGPGSFTGLRIAAAAAQGIALGLDLPVVGVSTLQAMAHQYYRQHGIELVLACIDARMKQVYWAAYQSQTLGDTRLIGDEHVADPGTVAAPDDRAWIIAGTGLQVCIDHSTSDILQSPPGLSSSHVPDASKLLPEAHDMLILAKPQLEKGQGVTAEQAIPIYLRDKVALTEAERAAKRNPS